MTQIFQIPDSHKGYKEKNFTIKEVKVDRADRIVEGYFASFDTLDSDDDIIRKGSFARSIEAHGPASVGNRRIAHLAFHDLTRMIGDIRKLEEDDIGLYFMSALGRDTEGNNALMRYEDGIIREHSIGFNYLEDGLEFVEGNEEKGTKGYWNITDVKLWEGSYVTFGSNENTPNLSAIKSQADLNNELEKINERMDDFIRAVKNKGYCKQYHNMHEFELEKLKSRYNALVKFDPTSLKQVKKEELQKSRQKKQDLLSKIKI